MPPTENIAIASSKNPASEEAIKEISLKIKSVLMNKSVHLILFFFTPQYKPLTLKETLRITLRPANIFGIQSPAVIFQGKVLKTGVVACCFSAENIDLRNIFTKDNDPGQIESILRKKHLSLKKGEKFILSSFGPKINIYNYLRAAELSLGKNTKIFGAGFIKKYGIKNFQIVDETIDEGISNVILSGQFTVNYKKTSGFLPLGRTFTITKVSPGKNIILEIDNKPAALIYKKYLENKFETFKKTSLGTLYPIGIKKENHYKIISVLDFLEDDSLFCLGEAKEGQQAKIMMATPSLMLDDIKKVSFQIKNEGNYDLVIIINSLLRRKILKRNADKDITVLKTALGEKTKIIGLYADYQVFPEKGTEEFSIENNHICMILLSYEKF